MRTLWILAMLVVVGCNGKKPQKLTPQNYETLKAINDSFGENAAAMDTALGTGPKGVKNPEKVAKLADMIKDNCERKYETSEPGGSGRYTEDWKTEQAVKQKNGVCLVNLSQAEAFNSRTREYFINEIFATSGSYQKESMIQSYTVTGGMRVDDEGTRTKVSGVFQFKNFKVNQLGNVYVRVVTNQSYSNGAGGGSTIVYFQAKDMKYTATFYWTPGGQRSFRINGEKVDENTILALFSGYGLLEIVDRSARMR